MSRKSVTKRLRMTRRGKVLRRAMALGHSKSNKSPKQKRRKRNMRSLTILKKEIYRHL